MKHKLLLLLVVLTTITSYSQTTYVFTGDGDWTDSTKWENGSYPGTTINANDIVEILGKVTISESVSNNGTIETYSTANTTPEVKIVGSLYNNKNINFSRATITVVANAIVITNTNSDMILTDSSKLTNNGTILILGGIISISSSNSSIVNDGLGIISNNGGTLQVLAGTLGNKSTNINAIYNAGKIEVTNGSVTNNGSFNNDATGILNISKTFTNDVLGDIQNSGQITIKGFSTSMINKGNLNNLNNFNIEEDATFNCTNSSVFVSQASAGAFVVSESSTIINNASEFSIRSGKLSNNGTIENNTSIFIDKDGNLENNGTLNNNYSAPINNNGTLSGKNIVHKGSFSNDGILSPGNSSDATAFYKLDSFFTSYTQTATGSLNINLGGTIAGETYDQVNVDRDATIAGTLNVTLVDGFVPAVGNTFTILTKGGSLSGAFTTVNLPVLTGSMKWDAVEYSSDNGIRISVIDSSLDVTDFNNEALQIAIYPNPVSDKIFVSGISTTSNVSIFDLNGRKVLDSYISNSETSIDLKTLNSGVYLLKINGESFKFVKK